MQAKRRQCHRGLAGSKGRATEVRFPSGSLQTSGGWHHASHYRAQSGHFNANARLCASPVAGCASAKALTGPVTCYQDVSGLPRTPVEGSYPGAPITVTILAGVNICCAAAEFPRAVPAAEHAASLDRRVLLSAPLVFLALPKPAEAEELELTDYFDQADQFGLKIPSSWQLSIPVAPVDRFRAGVSSTRTLAWISPQGPQVNVTMVITAPGADYTSLGSFGTAQDFASNLVTSMDRSYELRGNSTPREDVQVCKLVSSRSSGNVYFVEYTIQRGTQPQKHLYSAVALGTNSRMRRFYTVTATCPESENSLIGSMLASCVNSLKVTV